VDRSHLAKLAGSQNRVLRGAWATRAAKRTQGAVWVGVISSEIVSLQVPKLYREPKAAPPGLMALPVGPVGVAALDTSGLGSPGTWETCGLRPVLAVRGPGEPPPGPRPERPSSVGAKPRACGRYRLANQESQRDGRAGVGVRRWTDEVGEPDSKGTLRRKGRTGVMDRWRG